MTRQQYRHFLSLILFFGILWAQLPATTAQTRRGGVNSPAQPPQQSNERCTGAWSGIVKYQRDYEDVFTEEKNDKNYSGHFSFVQRTQRRQVAGKIILDGQSDAGVPGFAVNVGGMMTGANAQTGRTSVSVLETYHEFSKSGYTDNCGWENRLKRCESTETRNGQTSAESGSENFFLQFQGDKYNFSFRLPEASGEIETVRKSACRGFCNGDTNDNQTFKDPVRYDREPVSAKNQKFDPKNPDRLRGAQTVTSPDGKTTTFVSWNLRRCAPPLQLIDLRFQEHRFPDTKEWIGISPQRGTIDGNRIRVVARVLNTSSAPRQATVTFSEAREPLRNPTVTATVAGGEVKDIEYIWDTNGFAWAVGGVPSSQRKIEAKMASEMISEEILVKPKPVVLIGGYWTNSDAWRSYADYLKRAHSEHWQASPVGSIPMMGKAIAPSASIAQNAAELETHIKALRQRLNAWHVDAVAHSSGGLIARFYIHNSMKPVYDGRPEIAHLTMLGTPNNGSPCADVFGTGRALFGKSVEAFDELRTKAMEDFNRKIVYRKNTRFSVLAGVISPLTCTSLETGDGFVPFSSAEYAVADYVKVLRSHQGLTGEQDFQVFVKPRLDLTPTEAEYEASEFIGGIVPGVENSAGAETNDFFRIPAAWQASAGRKIFSTQTADEVPDEPMQGVSLRKAVRLPAGRSTEIDVPVLAGARAAIVLLAASSVSASLLDAGGKVVGQSAGTEAGEIFRTIVMQKPAGGNLKLRLENAGAEETLALVAAWTDTDPLQFTVSAAPPNQAGQIALLAKLTLNDAPVSGATIKANVSGQKAEIVFFDDGRHADEAAGDGVYGATLEKLGAGEYFVKASAETGQKTRAAFTSFKIGK